MALFQLHFLQNACFYVRMTPKGGHLCRLDTFLVFHKNYLEKVIITIEKRCIQINLFLISPFTHAIFDLITAHTSISAQSRNSVMFRLQPKYFLCPATKKVAGYYVIPSEILSVHPSVRQSPHHFSARKSSYSFRPIVFKLYRCF